ncbi:MAG: amino acid ABC transporter permease [Rhodoglobus sp.]
MSSASGPASRASAAPGAAPSGAPERIVAIPLRHPVRNTLAVVVVLALLLFIWDAFTNRPAYDWPAVGKYLFDVRVSQAALVTIELTILSMVGAVLLGTVLAVMRLSPNSVLRNIALLYLWVFRGTPVYVQLVFWGLFATIYKTIFVGVPFTSFYAVFTTQDAITVFWLAVIGLALNEAAYMAEIVRAGMLSVDPGQGEAATALGMSWSQTMRRIIIPQSMRVIIPPTGNEVISMLKTTSLVTAVPLSTDLYTRTRDISAETFNPIPLLIVASIWYLFFTSILMTGQYFLERHFGRGTRYVDLGAAKVGDAMVVEPPTTGAVSTPVTRRTDLTDSEDRQ